MAKTKQTYKNKKSDVPLLTTISSGCKTPLFEVKFCNLVKPFYYPNSPSIPRYSITCVFDPKIYEDFLKTIKTIEKNENVESIIKKETCVKNKETCFTEKLLIKFQTKEVVPVYICDDPDNPEQIELEDELARGEKVSVTYDILRYTKKNVIGLEHGISFKPTAIYYYPELED